MSSGEGSFAGEDSIAAPAPPPAAPRPPSSPHSPTSPRPPPTPNRPDAFVHQPTRLPRSGRRTSTASLAKAAAKEAHIQAVCEAKGISDDELARLRSNFARFDVDDSQTLDASELKALMQQLTGRSYTDSEIDVTLQAVNPGQDSASIDFLAFVDWWSIQTVCAEKNISSKVLAALRANFAKYDVDGSNSLDVAEFAALLADMGGQYSEEEVAAILEQVDADSSGLVDFVEFLEWWASMDDDDGAESHEAVQEKHVVVTREVFESKLQARTDFASFEEFAAAVGEAGGPQA